MMNVRRKMAFKPAQASNWPSFFSSFWAFFRKIRLFSGRLRRAVFEGKVPTLTVSFVSLWNVTVRPR